jgi:hypothetical protein
MSAHSKIGASSMARWSACPGSVHLSGGIPSKSSAYAEEGTLAHELAEHFLTAGRFSPLPFEATAEMEETIKLYVNEVRKHIELGVTWIEKKFDLSSIHPGLFGTADAVVYNPKTQTLYVFDLKYGAGLPVEVTGNKQLLYYCLGAALTIDQPIKEIVMTIVQPRCPHPDGPIRKWTFGMESLIDFAMELKEAAVRTEEPDAPLNPGDHCRFCPAASTCPKLHEMALSTARAEFAPSLPYDPKKLSETLIRLPALEAFIKNVREFAYEEAQAGRCPPGFKLVEKRATRKWRSTDDVEARAEAAAISEDLYEKKIKSPAQVEKALGKKLFREIFDGATVSESTGFVLAPDSDKREAVSLDASQDFTAIES